MKFQWIRYSDFGSQLSSQIPNNGHLLKIDLNSEHLNGRNIWIVTFACNSSGNSPWYQNQNYGPVFKWWSKYKSADQMVIWILNIHGTVHLNSEPFNEQTNPLDLNSKLVCYSDPHCICPWTAKLEWKCWCCNSRRHTVKPARGVKCLIQVVHDFTFTIFFISVPFYLCSSDICPRFNIKIMQYLVKKRLGEKRQIIPVNIFLYLTKEIFLNDVTQIWPPPTKLSIILTSLHLLSLKWVALLLWRHLWIYPKTTPLETKMWLPKFGRLMWNLKITHLHVKSWM